MAVSYSTAVKTSRMTVVRDAIDAGPAAGYLEICSASYAAVLATVPFSDPCGSVSSGVLTFTVPMSDSSADATGTAAIARVKDSTGAIVISGLTVSTSGADINLLTTSIVAGMPVNITSAAITHG